MIMLLAAPGTVAALFRRGSEEIQVAVKGEICGMGPQFGHNVSHSNRKTNRMWLPNTHKATIQVAGLSKRVNACTRCLRTISKSQG